MAKNWWKNKNLDFFLIIDIPPSAFPPSKNFAIIPIHVPLLKNFIDTLSKSPIWKFILHPCPYPPATKTCKFYSRFLEIWKQNRKKFLWRIVLRTFGSPPTSPQKFFGPLPLTENFPWPRMDITQVNFIFVFHLIQLFQIWQILKHFTKLEHFIKHKPLFSKECSVVV